MKHLLVIGLASALAVPNLLPAFAHGGGLNAEGCHNDRKRGTYHCHRSSYKPRTATISPSSTLSISSLRPPHSERPSADLVFAAQQLLSITGCHQGEVDGQYGPETESAIKRFQEKQRLPIDGKVDDRLIADLSRAVSPTPVCN